MSQVLEGGIRSALDCAGYRDEPETVEALINCFLDFVDAGCWRDLDLEDAEEEIRNGEISVPDMIRALRRA